MNVEELAQVINYLIEKEMDPVVEMLEGVLKSLKNLNERLDLLEETETFW